MERLDKFIASQTEYSRKDVKKMILSKQILLNGNVVKSADEKIDIENDEVSVRGNVIGYKKDVYLILNKPKGYISATEDKVDKVVVDLVPDEFKHRELFPIGRLDKDTTGLLIITTDGVMAHNLLAPKKHVNKVYEVTLDIEVTDEMKAGFESGVKLNDGMCKPAKLEKIDSNVALVTLTEGKFHQIKRMFGCFGAKVVELNRIQMGNLKLPEDLELGECRELTDMELKSLQELGE